MKKAVFDYTHHITLLMEDIIRRCPELSHVDMNRVVAAITASRTGGVHGTYAKIVPLRFEGGVPEVTVRRRRYRMQTLIHQERELLYVIYFVVPRFIDLDFRRKLSTVFHELYHISPDFNGDIRRFNSRNYAHGSSRKRYNEKMDQLAEVYLRDHPDPELLEFLRHPQSELEKRWGGVTGRRVTQPRAVRVT